jgi:glycosyltransferase involved in cell wall biosynthesis
MKILLVVTKGDLGGAQNRLAELARIFTEKGHEVSVAFGSGKYLEEKLGANNISIHHFTHLRRSRNPLKIIFFVREMKRFLEQNPFDVVHFNSSNTLAGALGARLSKALSSESEITGASVKPHTVFTFRGLSMLDPDAAGSKLVKIIYLLYFKIFLRYIDTPVFQCEKNFTDAKKMRLVKAGSVVYPGLDPEKMNFYEREKARKMLSEQTGVSLSKHFILGSIGRLSPEKNHAFLLKVFPQILERIPEAVLVIIGGGREKEKLQQMILEKGLQEKIFLLGSVEEAFRYNNAFDCFVLPSRYEGISVALSEALFSDVPVLVSNVGGNSELVGGEEDSLFTIDNEEQFLKKLLQVKNADEKEKERQCKIRRILREKINLENTANQYLALYRGPIPAEE